MNIRETRRLATEFALRRRVRQRIAAAARAKEGCQCLVCQNLRAALTDGAQMLQEAEAAGEPIAVPAGVRH